MIRVGSRTVRIQAFVAIMLLGSAPVAMGKCFHRVWEFYPNISQPYGGDGAVYHDGNGRPPPGIDIHLDISLDYFCDYCPCDTDYAAVTVVVYDCEDNVIGSERKEITVRPPCPACSSICEYWVVDEVFSITWDEPFTECGIAKKYKVYHEDTWSAGNLWEEEGCWKKRLPKEQLHSELYPVGYVTIITPPPPLACDPTNEKMLEDLLCYGEGCEFDPIPTENLHYYKRIDPRSLQANRTLHTLPWSPKSEHKWGEAVNGGFKAPEVAENEGILFVIAEFIDSTDFPTSEVVMLHRDAWQLPSTPPDVIPGTRIVDRHCRVMTPGEWYQFNVRAGSDDDPPSLQITWIWYDPDLDWNFDDCCSKMLREVMRIDVSVLPCDLQLREPVQPSFRRVIKEAGSGVDYTVQIPCCDKTGNLSAGFVAWPTPAGQRISQGHMTDWIFPDPPTNDFFCTPAPESACYHVDP